MSNGQRYQPDVAEPARSTLTVDRLNQVRRALRSRNQAGRGGPGSKAWTAALLLAAFAALAGVRFVMTAGGFRNSDDANNFLAGAEMAGGNWHLHGWTMAPDNYLPTDVFGEAVLRLLFGDHPVLMQGLEALIWAGIGLVGTGLAILGARRRHLPGIVSIALALLAFNIFQGQGRDIFHGQSRNIFLTGVASHGFTILLALLALTLVATGRDAAGAFRPAPVRTALLGGIVTIGSAADPIFDVIACLPIIGLALLDAPSRDDRRRLLPLVGATVGGVTLGQFLLHLNAQTQGFSSTSIPLQFATFPEMLNHLGFAAASIATVLGAELAGDGPGNADRGSTLIHLLRLPFVLGFAIVCCSVGGEVLRRVCRWPQRRPATRAAEIDQLLWISLAASIASVVITTVINNSAGVRFLLPATTMGSILVARRFGRFTLPALYAVGIMPASLLVLILTAGTPKTFAPPQIAILQALREHGLRHGYAGYWNASITTVAARREITVLALVGSNDRLHTFNWFCNLDWFRNAARNWHGRVFFVVARRSDDALELTPAMVAAQFGKPAETVDLGPTLIEIYDLPEHALAMLTP